MAKYSLKNVKINEISLVKKGANKRNFAIIKSDDSLEIESFQIIKTDEVKKQVTSIVYEPNTLDTHNDMMTAEEIEKTAHEFAKSGLGIVDVNHSKKEANAYVVESFVAKDDMQIGEQEVKKGSWIATVQIDDDKLWKQIEKGEINAFSMGGTGDKVEIEKNIDKKGDVEMNEKLIKKMEEIEKTLQESKGNTEIAKQLEELKTEISKMAENDNSEKMVEIEKSIITISEELKKSKLGGKAEVEKRDLNTELRGSIVKSCELTGKGGEFAQIVKSEISKSATTPADVSAIISVPISTDMIKYWSEISPLFSDSRKMKFKGESATISIKNKGTNSVEVVGIGQSTSGKGGIKFTTKKISKGVVQSEFPINDELVMDTQFNIMSEINDTIREDFAEYMADKIIYGVLADSTSYDGSRFEGIQTNTEFMNTRTANRGSATKLDWKELTSMKYKLKVGARAGAKYYVSKEAMEQMETMEDTQGRPLWKEATVLGNPNTFAGFPVVEVYNMGLATGDLDVLFANFNNLYVIATDYDMKMENDRKPQERLTNIITNSRLGGVVRDIQSGYGLKKI